LTDFLLRNTSCPNSLHRALPKSIEVYKFGTFILKFHVFLKLTTSAHVGCPIRHFNAFNHFECFQFISENKFLKLINAFLEDALARKLQIMFVVIVAKLLV
jgi:flagellar biosynthesis protein FlhB